jgi:putative inorganic carbon (hco3(-)) transporter
MLLRNILRKSYFAFKTPYNIALAGFMAVNLLGIFVARDFYAFLNTVYINFCYIALFYFTLNYAAEDESNYKKIYAAIIIPAVIMAAYGLLQSAGIDFIPWQTNFSYRAASTLGNPNFLAGHMVLVIPIAFAMIFTLKGINKIFMAAAAILLIAALIVTQTRGAYLAFIISAVVLFALLSVYDGENVKKYRGILIITCAMLVALGGTYFALNKNAAERIKSIITMNDESAKIRLHLWENTLYMIKDNFLLGSGPGNFPYKYSYYQARALDISYFKDSDFYKSGHAHNDYLQFMAEYGLPGAGFMFLVLGLFIYTGLRSMKKQASNKYLTAGALAAVADIMAHGFFNFPFIIVPTTSVFYVLMALSVYNQDDYDWEERKTGTPAGIFSAAAVAVFVMLCALFFRFLLSNAYLRAGRENDYFKKQDKAVQYAGLAVEANPWNEDNYLFNGQMLENANQLEPAFRNYKKVFDINPGNWEVNSALFNYYASKNMVPEALETGENMLKMSPYSLKALTAAGYALYMSGKYDQALKIYENALKDRPDSYDLLYHLSAVYGATGDTQKAAEYSERAIAASPDNAGAYLNLAVAYYKSGSKAKAIQTLNEMLKAHPGDARGLGLLKAIKK